MGLFGLSLPKKKDIDRLTNNVRDVFDANTQADQQRRLAAGQQRLYADQQRALGNQRPNQNIGQAFLGNTARFINTGKAGVGGVYGLGRVGAASLFGSDSDYQKKLFETNQTLQRDLSPNSGLFGAGTAFKNAQQARNISPKDLTKSIVGTGLGVTGELAPVQAGRSLKATSLAGNAAKFGAANVAADTGNQIIQTGKVNPKQTLAAGATGATLGVAAPILGAGARGVVRVSSNGAQKVLEPLKPASQVSQLSRAARNSFENQPVSAKPGGIERAKGEIDNGSARPIRVRTLDNGETFIEDGRHRLEAAKQMGIKDYPVEDVTDLYKQPAPQVGKTAETPAQGLPKLTNDFIGGYQANKTRNMGVTRSLPKLDDPGSVSLIDNIETGNTGGLPTQIRTILDAKHKELTDAGVDVGYIQDYFPHVWKNENQVRRDYQALNLKAGFQNPREFPTIAEGVKLGYQPKYTDYRQALNEYLNSADKLLQNRRYFDSLKNEGLIVESYDTPAGMRVIDAPGLPRPRPYIDEANGVQIQGNYYASPDVAKKLGRIFGDNSPHGGFEKGLDLSAYASRFLQDIGLAGGIPGTPLNAFTFAQVTKELLSGSIKNPIVATMKSFSKEGYRKYSDKNNDVIQSLQKQGISIRDDYNYKNLGEEITNMVEQAGGKKNAVARGWDKVFSDPTFKRFMPALQIEMFKKVQRGALKRNLSPEEADRVAGDAVANFYGLNRVAKESFRNKVGNDVATTVLFAPKYRESMWNFLIVNNAKALNPAEWGSREYRQNQKFMVGAALLLAGENYANEYLNGVGMAGNPDGKKDKLIIPADKIPGKPTNGKDIGIPFLPSIATVPRYLGSAGYNLATGKTEQAAKDASGFLSFGLRPLVDTFVTNENYFGDKIVDEGASPAEAAKQRAGYLLTQYQHPYIREGVRAATGKNKSAFETVSKASEAPLRFYNPETYTYGNGFVPKGKEGEKFTFTQQRERANLKKEINAIADKLKLNKRQKADFESLSAVEFNDDGTLKEDSNAFYKSQKFTSLQDDGVFEAMKRKAELNAKLNGKPIDPIFGLSGQDRRLVLWKKTLPPGTSDPSVKKLYEQDWYNEFRRKEDEYYTAKKDWNTQMGYKNQPEDNTYPTASEDVEKAQNGYFKLPKGTGARSAFIRNNPGLWNKMISFWEAKDQWTNGERSKLGLGPVDEETTTTSGSGGKYASSRGGSGGSRSGKVDTTVNMNSISVKGPTKLTNKAKLSKVSVRNRPVGKIRVTSRKSKV